MPRLDESASILRIEDLVSGEHAAQAAVYVYGDAAATAVAWCSLTAHFDGRKADYLFWFDVFTNLTANGEARH